MRYSGWFLKVCPRGSGLARRGRAARLTHQSLSGLGVEGLLPDARLVFTNQLSNSLQPSAARQPGEMKTLLPGKYGTKNSHIRFSSTLRITRMFDAKF